MSSSKERKVHLGVGGGSKQRRKTGMTKRPMCLGLGEGRWEDGLEWLWGQSKHLAGQGKNLGLYLKAMGSC